MDFIPNDRIAMSAFQYQEASELLFANAQHRVAVVNAALAVEIMLKSFLAKNTWQTDHSNGGWYKTYDDALKGHDLLKLYDKIDIKYKLLIEQQLQTIDSSTNIINELTEYRDYFAKARYDFEKEFIKSLNLEIISFAKKFKQVILAVRQLNILA